MADNRTRPGGTLTVEGWLPHYRHPSGAMLPVRVTWSGRGLPTAKRINGRLVYALPAGGDFIPPDAKDIDRAMRQGLGHDDEMTCTELAIRLADEYPTRIPSVCELMNRYGMSQAGAYRWRQRFARARGCE